MRQTNLYMESVGNLPPEMKKSAQLSFDIADSIYSAIKGQGMTQKEFARRMGKTEAEVSVWLSGQHNFSIRTLARISTVLGIDVISVRGT